MHVLLESNCLPARAFPLPAPPQVFDAPLYIGTDPDLAEFESFECSNVLREGTVATLGDGPSCQLGAGRKEIEIQIGIQPKINIFEPYNTLKFKEGVLARSDVRNKQYSGILTVPPPPRSPPETSVKVYLGVGLAY